MSPAQGEKIAVVLFNLGGPDNPEAVGPFLRNLFSDPAILRVPGPLRWVLSQVISRSRAPEAKKIYAELGGGSPIVPETLKQAAALEAALSGEGLTVKLFTVMRYWHPRARDVVKDIAAFAPSRIVSLPLYPQFSTTTTASSLAEFKQELRKAGIAADVSGPCCYPVEPGFVAAYADLIEKALAGAKKHGTPRLLFSAHGLPERIVAGGDPYAWQVEASARAIASALDGEVPDWVVTYQSRVGPLKWIGPPTDEVIARTAGEGMVPVVCPLAFVSEHSETLVELDIEYRKLAEEHGAPAYIRVPAVGTHPRFIEGLAGLVRGALAAKDCVRHCPPGFAGCPRKAA